MNNSQEDEAEERMQANSQLIDKQKIISELNQEIQSLKDVIALKEDEVQQFIMKLNQQKVSIDTQQKIHQDELQVKQAIISKLKQDIERIEEELQTALNRQPEQIRDYTREKQLVMQF